MAPGSRNELVEKFAAHPGTATARRTPCRWRQGPRIITPGTPATTRHAGPHRAADEEVRLNNLPPKANNILEALLYRGELPRGEAAAIIGTGERQARRVVSALIDLGVVTSESTRAPAAPRISGGPSLSLDAGIVPSNGGLILG